MVTDDNLSQGKVIIFDSMAAMNKISITKSKTQMCADFVEVFVDRILDQSFRYNEVRVIFDRYIEGSLKAQTMVGRTRVYSTVFQVHDEIKIDNLKTKTFLPSIETKNDLTVLVWLDKNPFQILQYPAHTQMFY